MKDNHTPFLRHFDPRSLGLKWLNRISVRRSMTGSASHWHAHDEHEIIFLLHGAVTYAFRKRENVELRGGQFLVIQKGLEHHILQGIDTPSFRLAFNLASDPEISPAPLRRAEHREMLGAILVARLTARPLPASTRALLIEIADLLAKQDPSSRLDPIESARLKLLSSLVLSDCAKVIRAKVGRAVPEDGKPSASHPHAERLGDEAIAYIARHAEESFDLKALIEHMGYSRSRLFTIFRERTGLSPAAYHLRLRFARARELLDTTDLTSEQISERLGFDSPAYFTYSFRRYCGLTPIAYRNRKHPTE